ncbi:hypothetical protein WH367_00360 [Comamonas sp. MYb21]
MTDIKLTIKTKGLASAGVRAIAGPSPGHAACQPLRASPWSGCLCDKRFSHRILRRVF